jgi:MoxR-like ATPase
MTSNKEREFPPAFLRRCLPLEIKKPDPEQLRDIVLAHLGLIDSAAEVRIEQFWSSWNRGELHATDQLLNALALLSGVTGEPGQPRRSAADRITRPLDQPAG